MGEENKKTLETFLKEIAEGVPEHNMNQREAFSPLKTSKFPALHNSKQHPAGATGTLSHVDVTSEGKGGKDETRESTAVDVVDEKRESNPMPPQTDKKTAKNVMVEGNKARVLIVEDTTELAEVIQATLENASLSVEWVSHGSKGLQRVKANTPDVLLLDIGLPDMTGWKLLEEIREWKKDEHDMPTVIVITAYGDPANRLIGKLQGIHSYLIKPFTPDEVEQVVQKALANKSE